MSDNDRKVVLTCAQPSGVLHLGNYLGAIRHWVSMIDQHDCLFGIVDLHAITVKYTPAELRKLTRETLALYIACGLDPEKCRLFVQSHVIGHTELAWVLGCLTPIGQLERMTQFKDKARRGGESVGAGLLFYPVLMAADILLYNADYVPVGDDQKQHVELCRDIAQRFNHTYSETFTLPEPLIQTTTARVKSLSDPTKKMSKSDENPAGCLYLTDSPELIRKKIGSAKTDSGSEIVVREDKPGVTNLLAIWSGASGRPIAELEEEAKSFNGYADLKPKVADAVIELLEPIQKRYAEIRSEKGYLEGIMKEGANVAQNRAYKVLGKVYRKAGFVERVR